MLNKNTVNKVILFGRIDQEPRWHAHGEHRALCFRLITLEKIKSGSEHYIHQEPHNIRLSERLADTPKLTKGTLVYIQGHLETKMSMDVNRVKHYRSEIIAQSIELMEEA